MTRPLVFISYSHKDGAEKDQLVSHLTALNLFDVSSDDDIGPGADWANEIEQKLAQATVAILLITADYLNSTFITTTEVPILLERYRKEGLIIIPLIAKACAWRKIPWIAGMNVKPKGGKAVWGDTGARPNEELAALAEEVADLVEKADKRPQIDVKPPVSIERSLSTLQKVLIIDDDAGYRDSLKLMLVDKPCIILEAGSVKEGKRHLRENPDLRTILLDLDLPDENGTALLEHIKDESARYKVIILTNHGELLPAPEARRYHVFWYLYKASQESPTEDLRFALDQALLDIKREELTNENKADDFEDVILNRYPTPFTYIYQVLKSDLPGSLQKITSQRDMLELLLSFSAYALLCEYLSSDDRNDALDDRIHSKLERPALGEWFNIISEILKNSSTRRPGRFERAFDTSFFGGRNKKNINSLITIRNKYLGHGTTRTEAEYRDIAVECDRLLIPLLQDYKFITGFLMCYVQSVQKVKSELWHRIVECTGANPQLLYAKRKFPSMLNADEVHLICLEDDQPISLHPFVLLKDCPKCSQPEIFFYSKFAGGEMHYSSYRTGHSTSTPDYIDDYSLLVKRHF